MVQRSRILCCFAVGDHSNRCFSPLLTMPMARRANFLTYLFTTLGVGIILLQLYNAALLGYAKFFSRSHDAPVSI
jgi:hypothetical protein